jgi:hypothetical protein
MNEYDLDELKKEAFELDVMKYASSVMKNQIKNVKNNYELFSLVALLHIQFYLTENNLTEPNEYMKKNVHLRPDLIFEMRE